MENSRVKYKYQHPRRGLLEGEGQFIEYARGTEIIDGKLYWITLAVVLDVNNQRYKMPADCIQFLPPSEEEMYF